jgi:MATE family multidrug resistance protein
MAATYFCTQLSGILGVFFVGHLGATELAAISLANVYCNVTGFSLLYGTLSALDTLASQFYGAQNYKVLHFLPGNVAKYLVLTLALTIAYHFRNRK